MVLIDIWYYVCGQALLNTSLPMTDYLSLASVSNCITNWNFSVVASEATFRLVFTSEGERVNLHDWYKATRFGPRLLSPSIIGIGAEWVFVLGSCLVHCRMFSSVSDLHLPDSGRTPLSKLGQPEMSPCVAKCPLRGKFGPGEDHWYLSIRGPALSIRDPVYQWEVLLFSFLPVKLVNLQGIY